MQQDSCVPLIYHPTNVLFLDDQQDFLEEVASTISDLSPYVLFDDPQAALRYLRKHTYQLDALSALISEQDFQSWAEQDADTFQLNFQLLQGDLSKPDRYKKVVEAYIDQHMPNMDGIAFCQQIKQERLSLQSIVLTGLMDDQKAIATFNQQIISGYVKKEDKQLHDKLRAMVKERSWRQFQELTIALTGSLSHLLKPIYDKHFISVFDKILKEYSIVEFYMLDSSCSFLLIDASGKTFVLIVRQPEDFEEAFEIARDGKATNQVLQEIKSYQKYPYSPSNKVYLQVEGQAWEDLLIPMSQVDGADYYYDIIEGPSMSIFSFDRYCLEVWNKFL